MKVSLLVIVSFALPLAYCLFAQQISDQLTCALTAEQAAQTSEGMQRDSLVSTRLRAINPEYADQYRAKSVKGKLDMVNYLANNVFDTVDIFAPENKSILEFLRLYDFRIPSIKDADHAELITRRLTEKFGATIRVRTTPLGNRSVSFGIYGVTTHDQMDSICCYLGELKKEYNAHSISVSFYRSTPVLKENGDIYEKDEKPLISLRIL
jgi:hypothetical protein